MFQRYKESWFFYRGHWQSMVRLVLLINFPLILAVGWFAPTEQQVIDRFTMLNQVAVSVQQDSQQSAIEQQSTDKLLSQYQNSEPLFTPGLGVLQTICWALSLAVLTLFMQQRIAGQPVNESALFRQGLKLLGMVGVATLLINMLVVMGLQLFILPGVWLMMKTTFVPFLIVEDRLSPLKAFRQSLIMTRGIASQMFLGMVLTGIIGLLVFTFTAGLLGFIAFPARLMVATTLMLLAMSFNTVFFYRYFCLIKESMPKQPGSHQQY
ncbi:hypothetical protein [Pelagibaculum spongiae]|uniref:Uncharacterized protein n=1 Tax=Pelagibaculum spongiae TaxID=2080658 RepID=A0A2V1GRX1_9GAMM|nr:hypothetical protein [Pelagibaculum spongiae]PVZ63547.1 hypothetical protein DC094_20920 [Pelagibaculum spongiae]